jgi:anti-sigma-K factor RskA
LIRHHHGDVKKLREIRDTIRHDNFVTTDNKNYVESLITMYLKNQPFAKPSSHQQSDTKIKLQPKSTPNSSDSKNNVAFSFSSNKKLGILAGVVAAIAIIVIVGFTAINQTSTTITEPLLVNVDQATYQRADIISISGNSKSVSTQSVELSIENANGKKIWNENINPKKDGQFSTLVIAGGNGWENDGVYILKATHSDLASEIEFKFLH